MDHFLIHIKIVSDETFSVALRRLQSEIWNAEIDILSRLLNVGLM